MSKTNDLTGFHGGDGKHLPPAKQDDLAPLKKSGVHPPDGDHVHFGGVASEVPPKKSNAGAPVREDLK